MYKIHTICFRIKNKKPYILPRGVFMCFAWLSEHTALRGRLYSGHSVSVKQELNCHVKDTNGS